MDVDRKVEKHLGECGLDFEGFILILECIYMHFRPVEG